MKQAWRVVVAVVVVVLMAATQGCQKAYDGGVLNLHYEPASGVTLLEERAGPPAVARFSGGLEWRSVPGALTGVDDEKHLEALLTDAATRAGLTLEGTVASARAGSIALGPVARFELRAATNRTLVYLIPVGMRFLVATLTVPTNEYVKAESTFERTLHTLKPM